MFQKLTHCTTSTVVQKIQVPGVRTLQTLTFGGKDLDILFITTAGISYSVFEAKINADVILPGAYGLLHKITGLGVRGRPYPKLPKKYAAVPCKKCKKRKMHKFC